MSLRFLTLKKIQVYAIEDGKTIRKVCLKYKVSYITTLAGAVAAVKGIEAVKGGHGGEGSVKSLQEYHALIK